MTRFIDRYWVASVNEYFFHTGIDLDREAWHEAEALSPITIYRSLPNLVSSITEMHLGEKSKGGAAAS